MGRLCKGPRRLPWASPEQRRLACLGERADRRSSRRHQSRADPTAKRPAARVRPAAPTALVAFFSLPSPALTGEDTNRLRCGPATHQPRVSTSWQPGSAARVRRTKQLRRQAKSAPARPVPPPPCSRTIPANRPSVLCGAPVAAASLCLSPGDPDRRAPAAPLLRRQQGRGDVCRVPGCTRSRAAKNFLSSVGLRGQRRTCTPSSPPGQPPRPLTEAIAGSPPRCAGQSRGRPRRISRCPAAGCLRGNSAPNQKRGARGRQDRPSLPHRPRGRAHSSCPPPRGEADNFPSPQGDTRSAPPSTDLSFPPLIPRKTGGRPPLWPRPPIPCR